ncbi:saccharopine dehydrogenase NADP-binding domain-containing protein [Streptomyces tricolor]|nr:saccharopine dehydrogenase NADP-binding domain-containing protein [Streptomyces tricolor]
MSRRAAPSTGSAPDCPPAAAWWPLCATAGRVLLWHRTADRAAGALAGLGLTGRAEPRALTPGALAASLEPGDIVVSMLPASLHAELLAVCVRAGAHFACSSYVSPEVTAQVPAAREAGVVVLAEAGLGPGHRPPSRTVSSAGPGRGSASTPRPPTGSPPTAAASPRCRTTSATASWPRSASSTRCAFGPARYLGGLARGPRRTAPGQARGRSSWTVRPSRRTRNRDSIPFLAPVPRAARRVAPRTFVRGTACGWTAG